MAWSLEYDAVPATSVTRGGMTCESGLRGGMTCMDHRGMNRLMFTMKNILDLLQNRDFSRSINSSQHFSTVSVLYLYSLSTVSVLYILIHGQRQRDFLKNVGNYFSTPKNQNFAASPKYFSL